MFPLPISSYLMIGLAVIAITGVGYGRYEHNVFEEYKADQVIETQKLKDQHQAAADKIEKDKNDQINAISSRLANALVELRNRPSRPKSEATNAATCGTGATLYAEDGAFLIGEAARSDTLRSALQACYDQYDSLEKVAK